MPDPGDVPPAVVSLLARRLDRPGFGATLVDLAARGWFEVRAPAGSAGPGVPALCVVPAETPGGPLTPFERRVVAHVALRAGARGEVPAPAWSWRPASPTAWRRWRAGRRSRESPSSTAR
jgi:hypothetical protein